MKTEYVCGWCRRKQWFSDGQACGRQCPLCKPEQKWMSKVDSLAGSIILGLEVPGKCRLVVPRVFLSDPIPGLPGRWCPNMAAEGEELCLYHLEQALEDDPFGDPVVEPEPVKPMAQMCTTVVLPVGAAAPEIEGSLF